LSALLLESCFCGESFAAPSRICKALFTLPGKILWELFGLLERLIDQPSLRIGSYPLWFPTEGESFMRNGFTVGQIAQVLRCHERSARQHLSEVNSAIDRSISDLGERIDSATVVALCRRHRDSILGRRLLSLLERAA
jgi:hypothetical protein